MACSSRFFGHQDAHQTSRIQGPSTEPIWADTYIWHSKCKWSNHRCPQWLIMTSRQKILPVLQVLSLSWTSQDKIKLQRKCVTWSLWRWPGRTNRASSGRCKRFRANQFHHGTFWRKVECRSSTKCECPSHCRRQSSHKCHCRRRLRCYLSFNAFRKANSFYSRNRGILGVFA